MYINVLKELTNTTQLPFIFIGSKFFGSHTDFFSHMKKLNENLESLLDE